MWETGISLARERARQDNDFTKGKTAMPIEDAVKIVREAQIGAYQLEDVTVFLGRRTVFDSKQGVAVTLYHEGTIGDLINGTTYRPSDFRVYEGVDRRQARELSKLSPARAMFAYLPFSKNWNMMFDMMFEKDKVQGGAKALERLHELYGSYCE